MKSVSQYNKIRKEETCEKEKSILKNFGYRFNTYWIYQNCDFFVSGSGSVGYDDFVYNAHTPYTYYTAVKYGLFNWIYGCEL